MKQKLLKLTTSLVVIIAFNLFTSGCWFNQTVEGNRLNKARLCWGESEDTGKRHSEQSCAEIGLVVQDERREIWMINSCGEEQFEPLDQENLKILKWPGDAPSCSSLREDGTPRD